MTCGSLFGQSPTRYGVTSLIAACLAFGSWALVVVLGFAMAYIAGLLALIGVVAGVLGIGTGLYYRGWPGIVGGLLGLAMIGWGAWSVAWALAHF
jgi:hypothetical protein